MKRSIGMPYKKNVLPAIILFVGASILPAREPDAAWALSSLLSPSVNDIDKAIAELSAVGKKGDRENAALGILHINRYIRTEELSAANDGAKAGKRRDGAKASDVYRADGYFRKLPASLAETPLFLAYRGMTYAFLAGIKTVFGVGDLKSMELCFASIQTDERDWFVRYVKGATLVKVGMGLPALPFFTEKKEKALIEGRRDLGYVRSADGLGYIPEEILKQVDLLLADGN